MPFYFKLGWSLSVLLAAAGLLVPAKHEKVWKWLFSASITTALATSLLIIWS